MPKNTRRPKSKEMKGVNQKAYYAMNRSAVLEKAYMNLCGIVIQHVKAIAEDNRDPQEAIVDLSMSWQQNDHMLKEAFMRIQGS
jgi:hypothetical protein